MLKWILLAISVLLLVWGILTPPGESGTAFYVLAAVFFLAAGGSWLLSPTREVTTSSLPSTGGKATSKDKKPYEL